MELKNYLEILWRRRWLILVTAITAVLVTIAGVTQVTPTYRASTVLRITPNTNTSIDFGMLEYIVRLKNTYAELAKSNVVLEEVQRQLGISRSPEELRENISVEFPASNQLIEIVVNDTHPAVAASVADALATILIEQGKQTRSGRAFELSIVDPAVIPTRPNQLGKEVMVVLGGVIGLVGGLGLVILFENIDTRLFTTKQIHEVTDLPILGEIPVLREQQHAASPERQAFHMLSAKILAHRCVRTIVITSPDPNEGKSTVAANLAHSMAQLGQQVVLVDADMRLPIQHQRFGLSNDVGLSTVLKKEIPLDGAIQHTNEGVHLLTSGPPPADAVKMLHSPEMRELLQQLSQHFDIVVIDTPALLVVADATIVAPLVDHVCVVVRQGFSKQEALQSACCQLKAVHAQPIGVIVNGLKQRNQYRYYQKKRLS